MSEQAKKSEQQAGEEARSKAEQIAASGRDVRDRIRKTFVDVVEKGKLDLDQMQTTARRMFDGAAEAVRRSVPDDPEGVLKDVTRGLADGLGSAASATRSALSNAAEKGQKFTREELDRTTKALSNIEKQFVETVSGIAGDLRDQLKTQGNDLIEHAKKAMADIRPAIEGALKAARQDPIKLAGETVKAGVEASRQTVGVLAQAMAGLLRGAGDVLAHVGDSVEGSSASGEKETKGKKQEGQGQGKSK